MRHSLFFSLCTAAGLLLTIQPQLMAQARSTSGTGSQANSTTGTSQFGSNSQLGEASTGVGQITGGERFLRENRQRGQMVGGGAAGVGNLADQTVDGASSQQGQRTQGGTSQFGNRGRTSGMSRFGSQFGSQFGNQFGGQFGNQGYGNRQRRTLRVPVTLGFTPSQNAAPAVTSQRVQSNLNRIPQIRTMGSVNVQMEGRVAVLKGQVATQHDRDLVARMMLLEPGIGDVRNELVVVGAQTGRAAATP